MISTDITGGGGGANQLLDLLSLVSNPAVYEAKIKALQDATAQHKAYVEAVGPASEVLRLRDEAKADRDAAAKELQGAKDEAAQLKADAEAERLAVIDAAKKDAAALTGTAQATLAAAQMREKEATAAKSAAEQAKQQADAAAGASKMAEDAAKAAKVAADKEKADAQALKASLIAKHQAFIESL